MENNVLDKNFYSHIKEILESARKKTYNAINFAMVEAYWEIGKSIVEIQDGNSNAEYGLKFITLLAEKLTYEYGKGFTTTNLKYMRQFYLTFKNRHALSDQLSWTHYRLIMKVTNEKARQFYIDESIKSNWSTRQLERQINTFSYERLLASNGNYDVVEDTTKKEKPKNPKSKYAITGLYCYPNDVSQKAKTLNFSNRNELEITDLNNLYLEEERLCFIPLNDHSIWFDTGTFESLYEASSFIRTMQQHQNILIGCPEAIAFRKKWIDIDIFIKICDNIGNNTYKQFLLSLLGG